MIEEDEDTIFLSIQTKFAGATRVQYVPPSAMRLVSPRC